MYSKFNPLRYPKYKIFNGKKYNRGTTVFPEKIGAKFSAKILRDSKIGIFARSVKVAQGAYLVYFREEK